MLVKSKKAGTLIPLIKCKKCRQRLPSNQFMKVRGIPVGNCVKCRSYYRSTAS